MDQKLSSVFIFCIKAYKFLLSPYFGQACCYQPTCSSYAHQAFLNHNIFKALYLTLFRVLRCHPLSQGGYDPVPGVQRND